MSVWRRFWISPPQLRGLPVGQAGEEWAAFLYRQRGFEIVAKNYALYGPKKLGEIDVVCRKGRRLVLVEVKTRQNEAFMQATEAVNWRKQNTLRRMAAHFLQRNPQYDGYEMQIDVMGIILDPVDNSVKDVKLISNAVEDLQ